MKEAFVLSFGRSGERRHGMILLLNPNATDEERSRLMQSIGQNGWPCHTSEVGNGMKMVSVETGDSEVDIGAWQNRTGVKKAYPLPVKLPGLQAGGE